MLKKLLGLGGEEHFDAVLATENWAAHLPSAFPKDGIRRRTLDILLNVGIPFNRWLGLRIKEITPDRVVVESPPTVLRRNHVGTAHACAQALIGEYPAGLVVSQHFPLDKYRFIISKLEVEYSKPGRGRLLGVAEAPVPFPELENGEGWVPMKTVITNEAGEEVAICLTRWQVKSWERIASDRAARTASSANNSKSV
jgi:acyl-coenzyme A thioesterase PaaI-like protein